MVYIRGLIALLISILGLCDASAIATHFGHSFSQSSFGDIGIKGESSSELNAFDKELSKLGPQKAAALHEALKRSPSLANDPSLKNVFLQANNGNVVSAAKQYAAYWKNRVELFGEKAFEQMSPEHALRDDAEALSYGHIRTLDQNEQVIVMDLSRIPKKCDFNSVARATVHIMLSAIQRSKRMQKDGVVFVVDVGNVRTFDYHWMKLAQYTGKHAFPAKTAGYCIANLPPVAVTWTRRIFMPFLGKEQKKVFKMASNPEELKECIGVDSLE